MMPWIWHQPANSIPHPLSVIMLATDSTSCKCWVSFMWEALIILENAHKSDHRLSSEPCEWETRILSDTSSSHTLNRLHTINALTHYCIAYKWRTECFENLTLCEINRSWGQNYREINIYTRIPYQNFKNGLMLKRFTKKIKMEE